MNVRLLLLSWRQSRGCCCLLSDYRLDEQLEGRRRSAVVVFRNEIWVTGRIGAGGAAGALGQNEAFATGGQQSRRMTFETSVAVLALGAVLRTGFAALIYENRTCE